MTIVEIKNRIKPVLIKYKIEKAGIFGSYARNMADESSDVDILVKTGNSMSLLQFSALKIALEDSLQKKVDLVEYDSIKPRMKEKILQEELSVI